MVICAQRLLLMFSPVSGIPSSSHPVSTAPNSRDPISPILWHQFTCTSSPEDTHPSPSPRKSIPWPMLAGASDYSTKQVRCAGPGCVAFFALAITILVQSEVLIARCRVRNHSDSPGCGVADAGRVACRTRLTRRQLQGTSVDQPGDPRSRPADRFLVLGNTKDGPHM